MRSLLKDVDEAFGGEYNDDEEAAYRPYSAMKGTQEQYYLNGRII